MDDIAKILEILNEENKDRYYNIAVGVYHESAMVRREENCIGYMFTNIGDTVAEVNGMIVFPATTPLTVLGDSRSVMSHKGDIYKGNLRLSFRQPLGVLPLLEIVQLFYLDKIK